MTLRRAFLIVAALPFLLGAANDAVPVPKSLRLDYVIKRDGDPIGTHVITFRRDHDDLLVHTRIDVAVRMLFVTVYRYGKSARETWRNGRIVAYRADTDDNGDPIKSRVVMTAKGLAAKGPNGETSAPPGTMISGYWNMATVKQTALLDSENVTLVPIKIKGGETARIAIGEQTFETRHYRITGELARELWYDERGLLIKMRAIASDGSVIDTDRTNGRKQN